jgi:hypothetical protein
MKNMGGGASGVGLWPCSLKEKEIMKKKATTTKLFIVVIAS